MKLEIGMYVRTKYGIAKYIEDLVTRETIYRLIDKEIVYDNVENWEDCLLDNEISKASHNIIDLIEVGDYVNGEKVILKNDGYIEIGTTNDYIGFNNEELVKSIVTKEMFANAEYKVETN